jgi:thiopeptide-type bacteriocin biosynthesis protein
MTDDAALVEPSERRRRGRGRGTPGLYEPVGWILVRAPLLPVEAYLALEPDQELAPRDPLVRTALAVGSRDLLPELERPGAHGPKETQRLRATLLRYLIRMSTRPTPYGLFAGVGLAELGDATDLRIATTPPRTRTRPDMEWLLRLVGRLEARPAVRRELRVFANPAVLQRGDRAYLGERAFLGETGDASPVAIRATGAVRRALALARTPVSWERLSEELLGTSGATPEKVEGLLDELFEQTFLLSELRPPLTHPSPARHVAGCLAGIASAADECAALAALLDAMTAWDELAMAARPDAYRALGALAADAVPDLNDAPAQIDTALALEGGRVHGAIAREAAKAAELLLRLSPSAVGLGQLDGYRHAFMGRYGADREVPILELLDRDHGLGPPSGHGWTGAGVDQAKLALRNQTLRGLAVDALRERRRAVAIDRVTLDRLALSSPTAETAPVSLDVAVFVLARSAAAIDAGEFELLIGPNLGAQEAGRNLGRFADLLGDAGRAALAAVAATDAREQTEVGVELVYLPRRGRSANVVIRPAIHRHEIAVGTMPGVAARDAIPLSEVLIGVRDGRFYARSPALEGDLRVHAGHMLNPHQAPVACRFLEDLAHDGRMPFNSFQWGPAAELPFLPRIRIGRVNLAAAQWQIDCAMRDASLAPSEADFAAALARWREAWMVPRHVYLAVADNRLLLDLEAPEQVEQLREELRQLQDGNVVVLQEPLPGPEHAWLIGPHGRHLTELVVPIALRATPRDAGDGGGRPRPATAARRRAVPSTGDRLRPPGSDWLFVKLYGPRNVEDDLLAGPIRGFCQFATGSGLADRWFFLRYSDPDPHLRLRFGGAPDRLVTELFPRICAWTGELIAAGSCLRVGFDTYEREIERYGGLAAIEAAEALFAADSAAVVELLRLAQGDLATIDRTALAVLSIDALLDGLGLDAARRLEWYRGEVGAKHHSGDDYRTRQSALRRLVGDPAGRLDEPGGQALERVLGARSAALAPVASRLRELAGTDELETPLERLCESFVHLHSNRLLGAGPPTEQHVLGLLLRTREGLERAPVAPRDPAA